MIYDHSWMISDHLRSWIQSNFQWKSWRIKDSIKNSSSEFIYQCKKQKYLSLEYLYQNKKENFEFRNKKSRYRNSKIYFYIKDRVIWTWSAITYDHWQNHEPRSLTIMIVRVKQIWATFTHDRQWSWMIADHIQITLSLTPSDFSKKCPPLTPDPIMWMI